MRNRVRRGTGCSRDGLSRCFDRCLGCNFALLRYQAMLVAAGKGMPQGAILGPTLCRVNARWCILTTKLICLPSNGLLNE